MATNEVIRTEYLIIGNSAGGIGAVEAIRSIDTKGAITIISEEPYPAYSRPLISKYLANERTIEGMLFRSPDFYSRHNINLLVGKKAVKVEPTRNVVQLESGEQIIWQKLLLATGGIPIIPKINGAATKGVFNFLTIQDAQRVAAFIKSGQQALVIGGGLIGISVTEALKKRGLHVTIVEMKNRILNTILDEEGSSIAEGTLKQAGISIITNHTASAIVGDSATEGIVLDSGERITCDLVVIAIGVLPRTELALNTEMEVNRGIVVDRYMTTNFPNIYACGDVAEAYDFIYNSNRATPIWPNAYAGGRVAGCNMAGVRTEYSGGTAMNSLNYFGIDIVTAGVVATLSNDHYEVLTRHSDGIYKKLVLDDDYITGMVFIRDIEKSGIIFSLMRDHVNVRDFKQELLSDNFGLAYLPKQLWQERLGAAPLYSVPVFAASVETEEPLAGE